MGGGWKDQSKTTWLSRLSVQKEAFLTAYNSRRGCNWGHDIADSGCSPFTAWHLWYCFNISILSCWWADSFIVCWIPGWSFWQHCHADGIHGGEGGGGGVHYICRALPNEFSWYLIFADGISSLIVWNSCMEIRRGLPSVMRYEAII